MGYHDKPIGLLNVAGYYDAMLTFLRSSAASGFMSEWQMGLMATDTDIHALLPRLIESKTGL